MSTSAAIATETPHPDEVRRVMAMLGARGGAARSAAKAAAARLNGAKRKAVAKAAK